MRIVCRVICIIMIVLAAIAVLCAITVTGSGFLDVSNIARYIFLACALVSSVLAVLMGFLGWRSEK